MTLAHYASSLAQSISSHYETVSVDRHQTWSWAGFTDFAFARPCLTAPIVLAELHQVASTLPIVFEDSPGGLLPVALLQMGHDGPHVVTEAGEWAAFYTPASLRLHPFACGLPGTAHDTQILLDPHSATLSQTPKHQRLFDVTGTPTAAWQAVLAHLEIYQRQLKITAVAAQSLTKAGMLAPARKFAMFDDPMFDHLKVVDRKAFNQLPLHRLGKLFQTGAMELTHAHFTSLETAAQIRRIAGDQTRATQGSQAAPAQPSVSGADSFLDAMAMAYETQGADDVPYDQGGS